MAKKPKVITKQQFARWSPEHQARALADRRTRMRIETAALPEEWRKKREAAQFNRTPITEGSATTYGDLAKQRAYMEPLTFGEGDRQLQDRTSNLAAARQRDADWFAQYRRDVQAAQDRAVGAQTAAVEGNKQLIDSANQVSVSSRDAIVRQLQDRAAQLGQVSQAADYQALADQAASARATSLANTAQRQVSDANTTVGSATNQVGVAGLKDLEAQGYRNRQESALNQDKRDYGTKKDAWRAKFIEDAIAEARKQVLEDKAYGLNAADKAADNARADASLTLQEKRLREQRRAARERERLAREREARQAASGGGGSRGRPSSNNANKRFSIALATMMDSGISASKIVKQSQKAADGKKHKYGVEWFIGQIMARNKSSGITREVAKRAIYTYIKYNGSAPSKINVNNAPKTPPWMKGQSR